MKTPLIIDAHMHIGPPGVFFSPRYNLNDYIVLMDRSNIEYAICSDLMQVIEGNWIDIDIANKIFEQSHGRIYSLCTYNPNYIDESLRAMDQMCQSSSVVGIKIHPSFHDIEGSSEKYRPVWDFAARHSLSILTHSWSVSAHNPAQKLSIPQQFEEYVKAYPDVHFVLGHCGGPGSGQLEAIRMLNEFSNVFADFAGDIFGYRLMENLVKRVPVEKIMFGSDFSWFDPNCQIARVLLSDIDMDAKLKIIRDNAIEVYHLDQKIRG